MRLDIYLHNSHPGNQQLDRIEKLLTQVLKKEGTIIMSLEAITQSVTDTESAEDAAVVLLGHLHDELVAAGTDPVALQALTDSLNTHKDALAAAIVANTDAAPVE